MKGKRIELRALDVDPKIKKRVAEIARKEERTESSLLKVIVREWLEKYKG